MSDSSNYAAAAEIRDAITSAAVDLIDQLRKLVNATAMSPSRRDYFAAMILNAQLTRQPGGSILGTVWKSFETEAPMIWKMADILDRADPGRGQAGQGVADSEGPIDPEDGIDLSTLRRPLRDEPDDE